MDTEWRTIPEFPAYAVSQDGRVRRVEARQDNGCGLRFPLPHEMQPFTMKHGYKSLVLTTPEGRKVSRRVHQLVALAFIGPKPTPGHWVAHNDGNPRNNHVSNLRWATPAENALDMRRHGTMQDGERCITAKLTEAQVREIRARYVPRKVTQYQLAAEYGVAVSQINRIVNNVRWRSLA